MNLSPRPGTGPSMVVIVGGGGFGRETLDVIDAHNRARPNDRIVVVGVLDSALETSARDLIEARGVRWLGSDDDWPASAGPDVKYLITLGDPASKHQIDERYLAAGREPHPGVIHPDAGIGSSAIFGPGIVVCSGAEISTNVRIGRHVHINPNATVGHDARLAEFVTVNPAAVISGNVEVAAGCLVGAGSVILQGRRVGPWSTVGAAACVVHDVEPETTVKGVPAR